MRRTATAIAAALFATAAAAQDPSPGWLQQRLESGFAEALGGTVKIGALDVEWTALAATLERVEITVPAEGAPPLTVSIAKARVQLAWSGLSGIGGGSIHITELAADGAAVSCSREWIDAWRPRKKKEARSVEVRVDRLALRDGAFTYSDARQRLVVRVREVAASGDWSTYRRLIIGEASGRAEIEAPLFRTPFPVSGRGGVRVGLGRVEIFAAAATGPGVVAQVESGTVTWGTGTSFTAEGHARADLAEVHPFLTGKLPLSGWVEGPVQIIQAGGPVRVVLPHAATRNLRVGPVVTESAVATLTVRPGALEVRSLDARAYGGRFTGAVDLAFGKELKLATDLAGEGADLGAILALTGKTLPLASTAAVTLKVEGDPGALTTWTGEGTFDAVPRAPDPAGRLPAGGRGRISFAEGRVRVVSERLDVAAASLSLSLTSPLPPSEPEIDLALAGTTRDAAVTHAGTLRLLDALEVPKNRFVTEPISGSGSLKARVVTGERPTFKIELDLAEGAWVGQGFDRAQLVVDVDRDAVALSDVRVVRGEESLEGSARFASGSGDLTAVDVHGRAVRLGPILSGLGVEMPIDGRLDLEVTGDAATGTLLASGRVRLDAATVGKEIVDWVESPLSVEGSVVALPAIEVHGAGVEGRGSATYDLATRESHIELEPLTLHLAAVRTLAEAGLFADGHVELRGPIAIDSAGPRGFLTLGASTARVGTDATRLVTLGDFAGTAALAPEGIELATASQPDPAWTFDAFLGWQSTVPISAVLYFDDLRVGGTASLVGEAVDLRLRGQVAVEGELSDPKHLLVNGAFDEVTARVGSRSLQAAEPFPVKLEAGRFAIGPSRFAGDGASLEVAADGELGGGVTGRVRGDLDLGIASSFWSELRGSGPVKVDATIAGTLERLDLAGRLTLKGGQLRLVGYRTTLEQIDAEAVLEGNTISLTQLHAFQGGGEVSGSGKIVLDGLGPGTWRATVQAANVAIVFPEGFKGVYQGHLLIDGNPKTTTVAGRIDVISGLYSKDFEVSAFGGASREFEDLAESPFPRNIFLDVDVVAPGNVWVRNEIAKLEASADLHIGGELARPQISGRLALLPGGTVRFRDVDYRVEYGAIDLTDPKRMNPYVDIRGRTRVGDYEIALHVEGTADKFDYELTSTPPLSSQDIISLLVTGRTLDDISESGATSDLPGDMAAYYFAGLLSSRYGKQIQRSLGVDELAVTPMLLKGETDPTARVTIGKRVGNDVKLVFSQDIGTAEKQTYQVVWDATRRVRFVAESDSESGLGGEAQYAQQFGGSKSTVTRPSSVRAVSDADPPGVVASLRVEDAQSGPPKEAAKAAKATKVRVGDPFERGRVLAGSDRLRERLLKAGYIEAVIRPEITRDPSTGGYHVVYRVTRGPKITVDVVAVNGKGKRAARRALRAYWRETPFSFGYWEEATLALIETFRDDGYFAADATWETEEGPAGTVVRFRVDRGAHVTLRALRLHGVSQLPLETVEKAVTSLQSGRLRKPLLKAGQLDDDLAAVRALYRDEGFARVRIGRPRIALSAQADAAEVDVDVEEGPRFTVRELTFEGDSPVDEEEMRSWIRLAPGRLFSPRALTEAEQALRDRLDARGFPEVAVESSVTLGADTADLAFVVTPGEHKRVGAILFEGNEVTKNRTIARALTFGQGDVLSRQAMIASQQRLYRTGLFSNVRFTYEPAGGDDPAVQRVVVHVDEAPPITFSTGLGYDSEDGARASLLVGYSNLFGRGIAVALQGLVSEEDQRAQLTFRRRQLFGGATDALASLLYENLTKEGFSEARTAASFRWERRPRPRWIRYFRYNIQDVRIADITDRNEFIEQTFDDKLSAIRLGDFGIGIVRDTRDDAFIPTRGGYASAEGTVFSEYLGSQADFVALFLRGALTKSLPRGLRFASFLRVGLQQPYATTDIVPLSERYFAGGSNTMRGFEEDSVGGLLLEVPQVDADGNPILDENGNPLPPEIFNAGGEAIILFNEELHFPIWKSIRGEIFLDAGNVYPTISEIDWGSLRFRFSGGLGLRIDTPIGPIRVEYGWKLDREEGETPGEWILAIGQVF